MKKLLLILVVAVMYSSAKAKKFYSLAPLLNGV